MYFRTELDCVGLKELNGVLFAHYLSYFLLPHACKRLSLDYASEVQHLFRNGAVVHQIEITVVCDQNEVCVEPALHEDDFQQWLSQKQLETR